MPTPNQSFHVLGGLSGLGAFGFAGAAGGVAPHQRLATTMIKVMSKTCSISGPYWALTNVVGLAPIHKLTGA